MSKTSKQGRMFESGEDSPLFSGVPVRARESIPQYPTVIPQTGIFTCPVCMDGGIVRDRFCLCPTGQAAKAEFENDMANREMLLEAMNEEELLEEEEDAQADSDDDAVFAANLREFAQWELERLHATPT